MQENPIEFEPGLFRLNGLLERAGLGGAEAAPRIGIVAGSGMGALAERAQGAAGLDFGEIDGLGDAGVEGHAGRWVVGRVAGTPVHVVSGRRHLYEGVDGATAVRAVRLMAALGVRLLILTNAAGGLSPRLRVGDLMLIVDQINFSFRNPLVGPNREELGPRFPDMSEPYDRAAQAFVRRAAQQREIVLREGVYAQMLGPTYETTAEIAMLRRLGAHAVGMSTVPETLAARHAGMRVVGLSLITNDCLGREGAEGAKTTHEEVLRVAAAGREKMIGLLEAALPALGRLTHSPSYGE